MKTYRILLILLIGYTCFYNSLSAQTSDEEAPFSYALPQEFRIGGITISGTKYLDPDILISLSGLKQGQTVTVPGEDFAKAIQNLWKQGLFTDISITATKIAGQDIFIDIYLQERPRLSRYTITGVKKSEVEDIRKKIRLTKGRIVTENMKLATIDIIKKYFRDKGYLNASVTITESMDSLLVNSVLLNIHIKKGKKVKIEKIDFEGNRIISERKLKRLMKNTREKVHFDLRDFFRIKPYKTDTSGWTLQKAANNLSLYKFYEYVDKRVNLNIFKASKFVEEDYEADKKKIIEYYNNKGYRDAKIVSDSVWLSSGGLHIKIAVDEGRRYYFRNITFKGNTKYTDKELAAVLGIKKGDVYNQSLLEERLYMNPGGSDISSLYMDEGHLFFQVTPVEVLVEGDSIDLEIRIYEGPEAIINEVRIVGNTKTNEHVIRRELRTLPGHKFSRAELIRSQREIANLGYFDPEQLNVVPYPNPEDGTVDIEYTVVEKPSDQLELSAGWGGRGRGIVGTLGITFTNFSIKNFFNKEAWQPLPSGDGQRFSLRIQSNGKVYQSYNVSFTEPWLGGKKPNSLSVSLYRTRLADLDSERRVEGTLITNGTSVGFGTRLRWPDDYFTLLSTVNFQNFMLDNWVSSSFIINDGNSNNLSIQETISRNSIDAPIFPRRGSRISLSLKITPPYSLFSKKDYKSLDDNEKFKWIEYHKWRFDAEWFTPIVGNLILRTSAKFGFLGYFNKDIGLSPFERFELGGDGISNVTFYGRDIIAMRGYEVFTPNDGAAIFDKFTVELRYPLSLNPSSTVYALAFLEGGNYWNSIKEYNPFDIKRAAGIGVRIFLPMFGLLGFDYGIGFDKNLGEATGFGDYLGKYGKFSIILGFEPE